MQLLNKVAIKKSLAHTWYIYPISLALMSVLWVWGFYAFHQPSKHEKLTLFFATDIKDNSFLTDIQTEHYSKEKLREVNSKGMLPNGVEYLTVLQVYLADCDIFVLDDETMTRFSEIADHYFVEMNNYVKETYLFNSNEYYTSHEKDYGVLIKKKGETSFYSNYMTFDETKDYYLTLSITSTNLGRVISESNEYYDNALTYMHYLVEKSL